MNLNLPVPVGTLFLYYGVVIFSLLIVYLLGWLIKLYVFKTKDTVSAFSILTCSVLGMTSVIAVYSIIRTKGITVNWAIMLLFFMYLFSYKKNKLAVETKRHHHSPLWKYIGIICLANGLFFCYYVFRIIDFQQGMFYQYFCDFNYYAKLSQFLNLGYENGSLGYNFFKHITPQPYHYGELWVSAIMYKFSGLNALVVYSVSLPMFFNTLIFISLLAVIELRKKITIGYLVLAFVILLLSNILTHISDIFPPFKGWMPLLDTPKLLTIFLYLFTSMVLFQYNRKHAAYYALLLIPVLNFISIVAVFGTIGTFLLLDTIKKRIIKWEYWIPFVCLVFILSIYILQAGRRSTPGEDFHWGLLRLYITQPVYYAFAYIHVIALMFFLDKKRLWMSMKKNRSIFFIAFSISMTVSIIMRSYAYDSTQFVTGVFTVMIYVFVVITFLTIITSIRLNLQKKMLIGLFCTVSMIASMDAYNSLLVKNDWNSEYESKILKQLSPSQKEYRIGFYIGDSEKGNYVSGVVDAVAIPDLLDYYYNHVYHYSVNKGEHEANYFTDQTPFRDYYEAKKKQFPAIPDDDIRMNFIKENAIEYIRIYKSASPSESFLSNLTLIAENNINGERFYKVN